MVEINGKGDKQRPTDKEEFDKNYNRIFKRIKRESDGQEAFHSEKKQVKKKEHH